MSKQEEYDSLLRERDKTQANCDAAEARVEEYDYLLKRLRAAKAELTLLKDDYKDIQRKNKEIVNGDYDWTGSNYAEFLVKGEELTGSDKYYRKYVLDHVLDSLNDEITDIENKRRDSWGLFGDLVNALNSLANKIENFFN